MKLFTVGPVQMYPETLEIEGTQEPYFRTPEFSKIMLDIEKWFLKSLNAPNNSAFIGLTASGTGAMDATVLNLLSQKDKALIVNGGSFGARFSNICDKYGISHEDYMIPTFSAFSKEEFHKFENQGFTALLVNACDTSTGQKYDLDYLGDFCVRNNLLFIVDAVSAYIADPIDMENQHIDALLTASQKALALAPGVSLVALSPKAVDKLGKGFNTYYFDFADYISNQRRGQPPFTSAVGTMLALHQRLENISERGIEAATNEIAERAAYFRKLIKRLPVQIPSIPLSNCCTPIVFPNNDASNIYEKMRSKYDIVLTPSGGSLKDKQLRVGHLGNLHLSDYDEVVEKLEKELR